MNMAMLNEHIIQVSAVIQNLYLYIGIYNILYYTSIESDL
jgi:hypothetical protein